MKIAGLQNLSLVDFPGYLAMTVFSQGCNFRCGYCHNPELLDPQRCPEILEEDFFSLIKKRRDKIEGVVLTGGEPTLHSDLVDFASKIKEIGLKVKLDTNGSSPWKIYELIKKGLIDYLA
ncbi:MAG: anaerobic ribonucleoside-triphosphate reductase activating protein, partial [Candidatus Omnitrophica bacterium]|nr:anaerobic ribonucleoside-triphosphate reductase activating protein [Candidatus Omnitrophota bacterium]